MGEMKDKAIEVRSMTSHELCDQVRSFCERLTITHGDDAKAACWAAIELQARHGSPAIAYTHPAAKRAAEEASHMKRYSATVALLRAAATIDEQASRIKGYEIAETLRDFKKPSPSWQELLKERDALEAENKIAAEKICELQDEVRRIKSAQASLDEITRICRTRWDNEQSEAE